MVSTPVSPSKVYLLLISFFLHFFLVVNLCLQETDRKAGEKWTAGDPSRPAKWWYSTIHTVTAMIGAGVLSLPYAMAYLGWYSLFNHFTYFMP